jgi:hypothetical protein
MWRWQPYSSAICFPDLELYFAKLRTPESTAKITDFTDVVMIEEF